MTEDASESTAPVAAGTPPPSPRGISGRRVLLAVVLGVPLLLVPLLLSGTSWKRRVCLHTLAQQESSAFVVGSLPLGAGDVRDLDAWPPPPLHPHMLDRIGALPAATPAEWHRAMGASDATFFMDAERTMPFALAMQIPNTRALARSRAAIVEVRLLAAAVLDPANEADRACWQRLDAGLRDGLDRLQNLARRERRRPPVTPAEQFAERMLGRCLDALSADDPRAAVRAALCEQAP